MQCWSGSLGDLLRSRFFRLSVLNLLAWLMFSAAADPAWCSDKLVSVILTGNLERYRAVHQSFLRDLSQAQVTVYTQTPNADPLSLANSIRKAVAINSDLIVVYGAQAAVVAKQEVSAVPVLFADVYDPVKLGLDICHGENSCTVSGVSANTPLTTLLRALSDLAPAHRTVAALFSSDDPGSVQQCATLQELATSHGFEIEAHEVGSAEGLDELVSLLAARNMMLFISESALVQAHIDRILELAARKRLLVFSQIPGLCEKGALLTLEPELAEQGVRLADYANQVLRGVPITSLPIATPGKVDLVLNLDIARQHRMNISLDILNRTTRVVK